MSANKLSRRDVFRQGGLGAAAAALAATPAAPAATPATTNRTSNIYTRIGVRPFINCTATYTINGGTLTLPEVKEAMDEASRYSVNLDELMEKVGDRLAQLLQVDCAMITPGAAALTHTTSACVGRGRS